MVRQSHRKFGIGEDGYRVRQSSHRAGHHGEIVRVVGMNPSTPTRRTQAYRLLRNECGFTHHQARHLIMRHMSHLGEFRSVFYKGLKTDKEAWLDAAYPIALLSLREDPREAGRAIVTYCWPTPVSYTHLSAHETLR